MGVKLQFVLGVVLVSLVCGSKDTPSALPTSPATPENVALDKPEHHINLIEKSPKTETEQKNVNSNTQNNLTSIKSNKTEPHVELPTGDEDDNEKVETLSNNVVEKDRQDKAKENVIKKDLVDKNRDDRSRAIDANQPKYGPSDYHRKHNGYLSLNTDSEKYLDEIFNTKSTTDKFDDFDDMELTTPKTYYFDNRYRSAVHSIEQKLDDIDDDMDSEEDPQIERLTEKYETTPNSNFMKVQEIQGMKNNTIIDKNKVHKDMTVMQVKRVNINTSFQDTEIYDDDEDKDDKFPRGETDKLETTTSKNNFILTTRKSVAFTKPPVNRNNSYILSNNIETDTIKSINVVTSESPTTRTTREDDIEPLNYSGKVIRNSTTEKIQDNQIIPLQSTSTTITASKVSTTTIEHNLIPATENDEETTTNSEESFTLTARVIEDSRIIRIEENFTPTIKTTEAIKEETSTEESSSEETDEDSTINTERLTTNMIETTVVQTTDDTISKIPTETTTSFDRKTEPLIEEILTVNDEATTLRDRSSIVYHQESTTGSSEDERTDTQRTFVATTDTERFLTTTETEKKTIEHFSQDSTLATSEEETTKPEIQTGVPTEDQTAAMIKDEESITQADVGTTETGFRTSKSMNLANASRTGNPVGSTSSKIYQESFPTVSEINRRGTTTESEPNTTEGRSYTTVKTTDSPTESTSATPKIIEIVPSDFSKIEIIATTQKSDTTEVPTILETTGEMFSIFTPRDVKTVIPDSTEGVAAHPTTVTMAPTEKEFENLRTLPQEIPTEETTQVVHENYPTTTLGTTTTVSFLRIANIDGNHTTLSPETLPPSVNYLPDSTEVPTNDIKPSEDLFVITTTEDGSDTAATEGVTGTPEDKKGTIAAIVISTVGAVCLVLLAGLLYIMRKRQKRFNYGERCRPVSLDDYSVDNVSVYNSVRRKGNYRQSKRSYGNPAFDDPVAVSHPLNFPALAKFANNVEDVKAEFEEIPQIAARTSELPEGCETKNRYANVIPLPETRVCLKPIEGYPTSDYINANYVTGPKNVKGYYIATQAPMQNTVDDFWRMIWEQQSKVILMITHFFENGVEKCVDYLPPSEVLDCHRLFGDFQVTLKKRDVKDKYIISSLQLKNMVSNSWREVTHFWYMGWPEKGVPTEANSLIAFLIEARSYMKGSTLDKNAAVNGDMRNAPQTEINPVVVHCSPGTGRTGVVIACDIVIREFEQSRLIDIPRIVYRLRRDRANAVQTKEQYMFIYKVVSLYATKLTGGSLDSL